MTASPELAKRIAEGTLRRTRDGGLVLAHVKRVARAVAPQARSVAWLHDVVEHGGLTATDLLVAGFAGSEVQAVQLLTRGTATESDGPYLAHVAAIARYPGRAGWLAREVKIADIRDRIHHPQPRLSGWTPPYDEALRLLGSEGPTLPD